MGATFVARGFSGDTAQLVSLMSAAMSHRGFALIDIVSPCVTFNNHKGSGYSFDYFREHAELVNMSDFIPIREDIVIDMPEDESREVILHDGSMIRLKHVSHDHDETDRLAALAALHKAHQDETVLTGLLYVDPNAEDMHDVLGTTTLPLNGLTEKELCPGMSILDNINIGFR